MTSRTDEIYFQVKKAFMQKDPKKTLEMLKRIDYSDMDMEARRLHASDATDDAINHAKEMSWKIRRS